VTAVDDCPDTFDVARRWFHLPEQVECVHADACDFLASATGKWNAVAIDIYRGFEIPEGVLSARVAQSLTDVLHPGGLIVWNVAADVVSAPADRVCELLRAAGLRPRRLQVVCPFEGNALVLCRTSLNRSPAAGC
jgi:spermidine synthase